MNGGALSLGRETFPCLDHTSPMVSTPLLAAGLVITAALLACSALFSSAETAIFSLSPGWIEERAGSGGSAAVLGELREDPHRLLVTLLVGNNVVNIAIASVVTILVGSYLSAWAAILVTTALTSTVVLVCGEILPKSYGLGNARRWAVRVAPVIRAVEILLWPAIAVFDPVTRRVAARLGGEPEIESPYL